ncbi:MAG: RDD family protein, partial [Actinobacteria bacterium]|nr:RDD family protein [Actinomycetota bacterium]
LGKRSLGIRVVRSSDQSRIGVLAAGLRAVVFLAGPSIFVLLGGLSPFNYAGGVLWAADAGLPLLDLQAQSLHDKLAGTIVIRKRPVS